jgi:hypothetical protein
MWKKNLGLSLYAALLAVTLFAAVNNVTWNGVRTVDIWGIFWIFVLLAIFYAVIYYDVIFAKLFRRKSES